MTGEEFVEDRWRIRGAERNGGGELPEARGRIEEERERM